MPRISIKPLIKLSKEQYKVLYERLLSKTGGKFTSKMAGAVMGRPFEPPEGIRTVGELTPRARILGGEAKGLPIRLPIEEARARYFAAPEEYVPGMVAPRAKVMSIPPGIEEAGVSSEELASKIAYEHIKQAPIIPPHTVSRTQKFVGKELRQQELESAIKRRLGLSPEYDIRPGVKLETVLEERGIKPSDVINVTPAFELAVYAEKADELWKFIGGTRSLGAKVFENLRQASRQRTHIQTARDYFISSYVRWKQAPKDFARKYPREAKILEQLVKEYEAPPAVSIPGTIPPGGKAGGGVAIGGVD